MGKWMESPAWSRLGPPSVETLREGRVGGRMRDCFADCDEFFPSSFGGCHDPEGRPIAVHGEPSERFLKQLFEGSRSLDGGK